MKINYTFDGIECDVDTTTPSDFEPKSERKLCDGVEYEFVVIVVSSDFADFMENFDEEPQQTLERWAIYTCAYRNIFYTPWFSVEALEEDEKFIAFMKERYEEEAREECQKENEE